jgi:hypothetical protein
MTPYIFFVLFTKYSDDKIKRLRLAGHVSCMEERRNAYKVVVGYLHRNIRHGRPKLRYISSI